MRQVTLPPPSSVRRLEVRGPTGRRRCRSGEGARRAFHRALAQAAEEHDGWSLWWSDRPHIEDATTVVWLWPQDDGGGERSATLLTQVVEAAGFVLRREGRATRPPTLHRQPPVVRLGEAVAGTARFPDLDYQVDLEATAPSIARRFDFPVQPCPHCGQRVLPRRALWGMPTADMALPLALGETVAMGCVVEPEDALCRAVVEPSTAGSGDPIPALRRWMRRSPVGVGAAPGLPIRERSPGSAPRLRSRSHATIGGSGGRTRVQVPCRSWSAHCTIRPPPA